MMGVQQVAESFANDVLGLLREQVAEEVRGALGLKRILAKKPKPKKKEKLRSSARPKKKVQRARKRAAVHRMLRKRDEHRKRWSKLLKQKQRPALKNKLQRQKRKRAKVAGLRDAIFEHIKANPGTGKQAIAKHFKITYDSAHSHVRQLAKANRIERMNTTTGGRGADGQWRAHG